MTNAEEIRARARAHARQIEAVLWMTAQDLAVRWGVSVGFVRKIDPKQLPYMTLGSSRVRRYHPDDVAAFEAARNAPPVEKSA
jgi:hypothetical protein